MTRIDFRRTRGIIGLAMDLNLDLQELPRGQAQHLENLVAKANFFNLPENLVAMSTTQEYLYTLTIQASADQHTVHVTDTAAPDSLRTLIDELAVLAISKNHGLL